MEILERQGIHLVCLLILVGAVVWIARGDTLQGRFWQLSTRTWLCWALLVPILHQVFVALLWRAELHHNLLSSWLGSQAFLVYSSGFMILFLARPVTVVGLALANRGTLTVPPVLNWILSLGFFLISGYVLYSVLRYFSLKRALGIDHFQPEVYRGVPFVRQGIFRWTPNAMYLFAFLVLWVPGLLLGSKSALLAAGFNHIYIWVHYFTIEVPDRETIYG